MARAAAVAEAAAKEVALEATGPAKPEDLLVLAGAMLRPKSRGFIYLTTPKAML